RDYKVTGVQTCALPISVHLDEVGLRERSHRPCIVLTGTTRDPMTDQIEIPDSFPAAGAVAGKRVVITGASRGLGALLAHAFSHRSEEHTSELQSPCNLV